LEQIIGSFYQLYYSILDPKIWGSKLFIYMITIKLFKIYDFSYSNEVLISFPNLFPDQ